MDSLTRIRTTPSASKSGTWMAIAANLTPTFPLNFGHLVLPGYSAFYTVLLNLVLVLVLTPVFNALGSRAGSDETLASDYFA